MKWIALMVVTVVAGAVAVFAIYTFGWRDTATEPSAAPPGDERPVLTALEAEQLEQATLVIMAGRNYWAGTGGPAVTSAEIDRACSQVVDLIRRKALALGLPERVRFTIDHISDTGEAGLGACRVNLQSELAQALD